MLFIQQENFDTFSADVKNTNNLTLTVELNEEIIDAIINHYTTLIPVFVDNKNKITSAKIVENIGEKITF